MEGKESIIDKELEKKEMEDTKETLKEEKKFNKYEGKDKKRKKALKEMEKGEKKKKNWIKIIIIIGIIIVILAFISTIFAFVNINNKNIVSGVFIKGIDISGLSKEEAKGKIETIYLEKCEKEISLKYQDYETSILPNTIETKYEIDEAIDEAYNIGRNDNIFLDNYEILFTLIGKKNIELKLNINEEVAKQTIEDIGTKLPGVIVESSYYIEGENLIITKGTKGIKIDTENLLEKVKENLNTANINSDYIEIPVIEKEPEEIDIEKIHEEIYKEAKDAYYTKDPFTIYPEVEGVDFNIEEAKNIISSEEKEEYTIKLTITKPNITVNQIGTEAFPDQLSYFTTRYDSSAVDRTTNLRIACEKINGKVVLAGETFSYNKTLGERTIAAGYKNAKVYENGQVVDGIGGGICQISSTLYNAVLMANLEIVERRNHQFVTSYLPAGRDATVVYGMTDFKFKNTRKYPIKISAGIKNGIATISIFGIKEEEEYTFNFETKTIATLPFTTKYIEDSSLDVGTEKVKQKGANGIKTETYMTKMLKGKVVSRTLLSRDTYDPMQKIVLKGTKGAKTTETTTPKTPTQETNTTQTNTQNTQNITTEKPNTENENTTSAQNITNTNT